MVGKLERNAITLAYVGSVEPLNVQSRARLSAMVVGDELQEALEKCHHVGGAMAAESHRVP